MTKLADHLGQGDIAGKGSKLAWTNAVCEHLHLSPGSPAAEFINRSLNEGPSVIATAPNHTEHLKACAIGTWATVNSDSKEPALFFYHIYIQPDLKEDEQQVISDLLCTAEVHQKPPVPIFIRTVDRRVLKEATARGFSLASDYPCHLIDVLKQNEFPLGMYEYFLVWHPSDTQP